MAETVTLYRPVGPEELELIRQSGFAAFPPRLLAQPIFYPVLTEAYAVKIARDWNVPASGAGYVTRFDVLSSFLSAFEVQNAGGVTIFQISLSNGRGVRSGAGGPPDTYQIFEP